MNVFFKRSDQKVSFFFSFFFSGYQPNGIYHHSATNSGSSECEEVELTKFQQFMDKLVNAWTSLLKQQVADAIEKTSVQLKAPWFFLDEDISGEISGEIKTGFGSTGTVSQQLAINLIELRHGLVSKPMVSKPSCFLATRVSGGLKPVTFRVGPKSISIKKCVEVWSILRPCAMFSVGFVDWMVTTDLFLVTTD